MKNTTTTNSTTTKSIFTLILVLFILLIFMVNGYSQSNKPGYGFTLSRSSSGNGFGSIYNPGVSLTLGKNQLDLVANIQQRRLNFSGMQLSYSYNALNAENESGERLGLFAFSNVKLISNAYLTKDEANFEQKYASENQVNFSNLKLSTVEVYVGFGTKYCVSKYLKVVGAIGLGGWYTTSGMTKLYRDRASQSLTLKIGIECTIK